MSDDFSGKDLSGLFDDNEKCAYDALSEEVKRVNEPVLARLFRVTVRRLIAKIEAGTAVAGDISNAIRILQDNGIKMDFDEFDDDDSEDREVNDILSELERLNAEDAY